MVYADTSEPREIEKEAQAGPALIFAETPANPLMHISDIRKLSEISKKYGCILVIDNTFLTPALQKPLSCGADITLYSATKYLCGHHDSTAGCVVTGDDKLAEKLYLAISTKGNGLSPFDSFLVKRGLETLALRMRAHCENAKALFLYLKNREEITRIYYAGDPESAGYETMKGQTEGFGGMISFEIDESFDRNAFLAGLSLVGFAESLGGNATLITHPFTQTHASLSSREKAEAGIKKNLFRLSVGTEAVSDIIADIENAFALK